MEYHSMISSKHLLLLGTLLIMHHRLTEALSCKPCDPSACAKPDCIGNVIWDPCMCCKVCAKQELESCGGMFTINGQCDINLTCIIQPNHGELVTEHEPGICKYTDNCADVNCIVQESPICSEDSVLIEGYAPPGECCPLSSHCECRPERCSYNLCPPGSERVLERKGNNRPGTCCDIYTCRPADECAAVRCAAYDLDTIICPHDSVAVGDSSKSECCPGVNPVCQCRSNACTIPKCARGKPAQVTYRGDGKPGSCCDEYSCDGEIRFVGCSVNGKRHQHGSSYQREGCSVCECKNGLSHCEPLSCPPPSCTSLIMLPGACCPQCLDDVESTNGSYLPYYPRPLCKSDDGRTMYEVGDTWTTDPCTYCKCEAGGRVRCTAAFCQGPPLITVAPSLCPSLAGCKLSDADCPFGFKQDNNQCRLCECNPSATGCLPLADCNLVCPNGWQKDEFGCKMCRCLQRRCKDLSKCLKQCPYGYKRSKKGCDRCKCRRCPSMETCDKECNYGLDRNQHGCQVCKCRDSAASKDTKNVIPSRICKDPVTKRRRDDGERWSSDCYICVCRGGDVMCDVLKCPVPLCDKPVIKQGDCCATCAGSEASLPYPLIPQSLSCQHSDGKWYVEGDTWIIDHCTSCTCHSGHVMCTSLSCPPTPCKYPVYEEGECCAKCKGNFEESNSLQCYEDNGGKYEDGTEYRRDPCTSCKCTNGVSKCFSEHCPQTHDCENPVLRRGECCPRCLGQLPTVTTSCVDNETIWKNGDRWNITAVNCISCTCTNGKVDCFKPECEELPNKCKHITKPSGSCCSVCVLEEAGEPYVFTQTHKPSESAYEYDWLPLALGIGISFLIVILIVVLTFRFKKRYLRNHSRGKYTPGSPTLTASSEPSQVMVACSNLRAGSVATTRTLIVSTSSDEERSYSNLDQ